MVVSTERPTSDEYVGPTGTVHLHRVAAIAFLGISGPTLNRWAKSCPYRNGAAIVATRDPLKDGSAMWYVKDHVKEVKAAMDAEADGFYRIAGEKYAGEGKLRELFRIDPTTLDKLFRDGKVRIGPVRGRPGRPGRAYHVGDVEASIHNRGTKFDGVYKVPGKGRGFNLARAAHESGLKLNFLKKQFQHSAHLAEGKLLTYRMQPQTQRGRSKAEHVLLESDLIRLRQAVNAVPAMLKAKPNDLLHGPAIARQMGFSDRREKIALAFALLHWRKEGLLPSEYLWVKQRVGRRRAWHYDFEQFTRLLDGRDISAVAEWLKNHTDRRQGRMQKGRGRNRSGRTAAIYEMCYRLYHLEGKKEHTVMREVNASLGPNTIRNSERVRECSRRHRTRLEQENIAKT